MQDHAQDIQALMRSNRRLRFGYLLLAVAGLVVYSLTLPAPIQAQQGAGGGTDARVDANKVGDAQFVVPVEHPDGFAVIIDEEGKINIVNRNGRVVVPKRKYFVNGN